MRDVSDWKSIVQKLKQNECGFTSCDPTKPEGFSILCSLLNDEGWKSLINDLIVNPSQIRRELSIPRDPRFPDEEAIVEMVSEIREASAFTLDNLSRALEEEFLSKILKNEIEKTNFIDDIFYIIFSTPVVIKTEILQKISHQETLSLDIRFDAASRIYLQKVKMGKEYWMQLARTNPKSRLAPLAIAALAESNLQWAWELIKTLEISEIPSKFKLNYKTSFRTFIREYKKSKQEEISIDFPKKQLPEWSQKCINDILNEREFFNKIVANKPSLEKVTVGIAPFLDTMIFKLGVNEGIYRDEGLDIDIEFCKWNNIFDKLDEKKVDVIIGNKELCSFYNLQNQEDFSSVGNNIYYYSQDLFIYQGFAILTRNNSGLETFSDFRKKLSEEFKQGKRDHAGLTKAIIAEETFKQLIGKKIIASSTDHAVSLHLCARYYNLISNDDQLPFEIISDYDPNEGLQVFLRNENYADAYVGGIPQRIIANKHGEIQELITYEEIHDKSYDFANNYLAQSNGFVALSETNAANRHILRKLDRGWFETIGLITDEINLKKESKFLQKVIDEYNRTLDYFDNHTKIMDIGSIHERIGHQDFVEHFWQKWALFPTTPRLIKDLVATKQASVENRDDYRNAVHSRAS